MTEKATDRDSHDFDNDVDGITADPDPPEQHDEGININAEYAKGFPENACVQGSHACTMSSAAGTIASTLTHPGKGPLCLKESRRSSL